VAAAMAAAAAVETVAVAAEIAGNQ
jgi:hypothetical protein